MPTSPGLLEGRVRDVLDVGRGLPEDVLQGALGSVGLDVELAPRGGLDAVIAERGSDLSEGQRRRLALARLLAGECDVYVLDEPTSGLDDVAAALVLDALEGTAVLVAAHDDRVRRWADERHELVDRTLRALSR
jgi:ABC-type transport system involved in cytochrome bd biosynthesis fused ATPase/permease subunit